MNHDFEMMNLNIGIWIKILTLIGAAIAFFVGLRQYKKGQRWQKVQVLLSLIDSFESNKKIAFACSMLDWDEREVSLDGRKFHFKNEILVSALRVVEMDIAVSNGASQTDISNEAGSAFSKDENVIRDAFDAFFDFFHKLYSFQKSGLLSFSDYTYFYYWFELLRDIGNYKKDQRIQKTMHDYIIAYRFIGINQLLEEYSKNPTERLDIMEPAK